MCYSFRVRIGLSRRSPLRNVLCELCHLLESFGKAVLSRVTLDTSAISSSSVTSQSAHKKKSPPFQVGLFLLGALPEGARGDLKEGTSKVSQFYRPLLLLDHGSVGPASVRAACGSRANSRQTRASTSAKDSRGENRLTRTDDEPSIPQREVREEEKDR